MIQCIVFEVELLLPTSTSPPDIIHMTNETKPSLFFAVSSTSLASVPRLSEKSKGKARGKSVGQVTWQRKIERKGESLVKFIP